MNRQRTRGARRGRGASALQPGGSAIERAVTRRLAEMTRGQVFRPTLMPPLFSSQPWNNVIVRVLEDIPAETYKLKLSKIMECLRGQLGLFIEKAGHTSYIEVEFRIQSISVWLMVDGGVLKVMPLDFLRSGTVCELANIDSMAQKNMFATAGFIYPAAHSAHVFLSTDSDIAVCAIDGTKGHIEIHVKAVWRGANTADLRPTFASVPVSRRGRRTASVDHDDLTNEFENLTLEAQFSSQAETL